MSALENVTMQVLCLDEKGLGHVFLQKSGGHSESKKADGSFGDPGKTEKGK